MEYKHPEWSTEGQIERYGEEEGNRRITAHIQAFLYGPTEVEYEEYIKSPEWKRRADEAKKRVGWRCQVCNGEGPLDAHHRTYKNLGHELDIDITVLCRDCHELFSMNGKLKK